MLRRSSVLSVLFSCLFGTLFAPASPVHAADRLDTAFEKAIGTFVAEQFAAPYGTDADPLLAAYVRRVGANVAAVSSRTDITCRFMVLESDTANAYTLPGGYIMVTRGLLDAVDSDDELASVLAHEVGHVAKRHATEQIGFNVGVGVLRRVLPQKTLGRNGDTLLAVYSLLRTLNKSKEHERQADEEGLRFAGNAGYDPAGLVQFFDGLGGKQSRIEEYFATHPTPEKRIATAKKNPAVSRATPEARNKLAAGYAARGLTGLAETVRQNGEPLAFPQSAAPLPLPDYLSDERKLLDATADKERAALRKFYSVTRAAGILQQFLVLNTQLGDVRWIYLSGRAYGVQGRVSDIFSRTVRVLNTAPGTWDALSQDGLTNAPGTAAAINAALGRGETIRALDFLQGVASPLSRAQAATAAVLFDLNNQFVRLDNAGTWARYAALEATLRYAESELDRADDRSARANRVLSLARIRRYENRLNELVPQNDAAKRAVWNDLLTRRLAQPFPDTGDTGTATVRAMVGVSLGASPMAVWAKREPRDTLAEWVLHTENVSPENVATALRLTMLELEREIVARARHGSVKSHKPGVIPTSARQ